tara:strand:+ start:91 stop:408 length:318 start_codon:yes stop_codon:yes gene_type:complete
MKKFKTIILYFILIAFLHSCGGASDAAKVLKNEKITNTDEFLVKKRDPLILPPEYDTLPKPNSQNKSEKRDDNKINKILKLPDQSTSTSKGSSSVEESIMKNIRK